MSALPVEWLRSKMIAPPPLVGRQSGFPSKSPAPLFGFESCVGDPPLAGMLEICPPWLNAIFDASGDQVG
jgi:hypothetical protein